MAVNSTHEFIRSEPAAAASGLVYIVCPGALENGGGIGRQMGYFLEARKERRDGLTYEVVTRGGRGFWEPLPANPFGRSDISPQPPANSLRGGWRAGT